MEVQIFVYFFSIFKENLKKAGIDPTTLRAELLYHWGTVTYHLPIICLLLILKLRITSLKCTAYRKAETKEILNNNFDSILIHIIQFECVTKTEIIILYNLTQNIDICPKAAHCHLTSLLCHVS